MKCGKGSSKRSKKEAEKKAREEVIKLGDGYSNKNAGRWGTDRKNIQICA